ncbi:lytic murein transglycosylase [Balneola sp. MJW-20]|uniref:lytic murein transglycosylase n=1 Tax=Gracilimonas aurantiaca TaxID=3234185 RepID=UPI003467E5F6
MKKRILLISFFISSMMILSSAGNLHASSSGDVEKNIAELTKYFESKGYDFKSMLEDSRFKLVEDITSKFTRSAEVRIESLEDYQQVLRIDKKVKVLPEFLETYIADLEAAEAEYGIPKQIIAGILGVESEYGVYKGSYNPFNAYVSMYAEGYRSKFARAQLEELLIFAKKYDLDVFEMSSSYAGAMSYAQFIPYSLNRWFVGDDLYDMGNNIRSVAKYLAHFKEITGDVESAILRYNNSELYRGAVLGLAKEAEAILESE